MTEPTALLAGVRVLSLGGAESDAVTRLFVDLGGDVRRVASAGTGADRPRGPAVDGADIDYARHNAGKRTVVLDPALAGDRRRLLELADAADIVVDDGRPGSATDFGTDGAALARRFEALVVLSVSDFGATGPRACWRASDPVLCAMSTALSRSGPTTGTPVLPPLGLASATAVAQAAWAALVAYYHRLGSGRGEYIDFSRYEAVVQALDPPFGSEGQAAVGRKPSAQLWRGRPRNQNIYPVFDCGDGQVRICLLSPRQWRAMRAWLGEPAAFADDRFDTIAARYAASAELNAAIGELFAGRARDDLVAEGQSRGVPIAAVLSPAEAMSGEHFAAVGALADTVLAPGVTVPGPVGPFVVDGHHPASGEAVDGADWSPRRHPPARRGGGRPFDGLRILDLGVIVAGGELGRLFADLGAEVIKVESAAYPDGLRQAPPGQPMSRSWALTHRNEYSLGLDLRAPAGAELFGRLVAGCDAVLANFKPGTLDALGFGYERLRALNGSVVLAESSAFGATGPWSARMGYGPLVRATTGVTRLWQGYDATTIFPDHLVARITAIATLAALIRRDRTGAAAHVHISQAEVAVNALATSYVAEAARAAGRHVTAAPAVHAVLACAGDDEWCVVSVRGEADRAALAAALGRAGLPADPPALTAELGRWTATRDKTAVAEVLQAAGLAAAPMHRAVDVLADPQIRWRRVFTDMTHPLFDAPMPSETGPAPYTHIPPAALRPAPMPGEHTREICQKVLGMDAADTDRLIAAGVLFTTTDRRPS